MRIDVLLLSLAAAAQDPAPVEEIEGPVALPAELPSVRPPPDPARGQKLFQRHFSICHGREGDGRGPMRPFLNPVPQDFTGGSFKLRTTETGALPTDRDLFRTLTRGIRGTAMPSWAGLSEEDRWHLVDHVKSLSPRFAEEPPGRVIEVPPAPAVTRARIERGAAVYREMECGKCHGDDGRGYGVAPENFTDDYGVTVWPFDMTRGWKLKGGTSAHDVYRTFFTGLDGTSMPSYEPSIVEEDAWDLVFYVRSLYLDTEEPQD